MTKVISAIIIMSLPGPAMSEVQLNVIYPIYDQQLPEVDSTFIFGNVTPGTLLAIDNHDVSIHKQGGWIAYLPVTKGEFVFHLVAWSGEDTIRLDWPVQVGPLQLIELQTRPVIPHSPAPESATVFMVGDIFEFSFQAPPGGRGWFNIGMSDSAVMLPEIVESQMEHEDEGADRDVLQNLPLYDSTSFEYVTYSGFYPLHESDIGRHPVNYRYEPPGQWTTPAGMQREPFLYTDSILTVLPEFPPVIGILAGRSQIVRTAPAKGYKLIHQPPGIKIHITGMRDGFYRIRLAEGVSGYINVDSVTIAPPGILLGKGNIQTIGLDGIKEGVLLSAELGEKVPFEIRESLSPPGMEIDLYGVTGDVDWIRHNCGKDLVKLVSWSQPQDDIFRISLEFQSAGISGYKAGYNGDLFEVRLFPALKDRGVFSNPLKGARIAIDPGHSHDTGAVGPTGLEEKDANLWIAHELRLLLENKGADVLMTRYGHENVNLYDRPYITEKWGADILVSIHNNALPDGINPFVHNGSSVYYYHPHSRPLAEAIHRHLLEETGLPDYGMYYGNLALTRPTAMPAVLVECAFMMIPEQEALLKTDRFQKKCARAVLKGIEDYLKGR